MNRKRIFTFIDFFSIMCFFAFCNENFIFSIQPETGIFNGHIYEYVFNEKCLNTDNKESMLDWEVKAIPTFDLSAGADIYKYLNITLNGRFGIPKNSGNLQDYDWLNYFYWPDEDPTELTNYSCHTNNLKEYYSFRAAAGGNIYLPISLKLTPFAAYDYEYIAFDAYDGYGNYKKSTGQFEKKEFSGKIISYKQEYNSFMVGLNTFYSYNNKFDITVLFMLSPKLSFNTSLDYHYINYTTHGTLFYDDLNFVFQLKSKVAANYYFNNYNKAGITFACQYVPVSKGTDKYITITSDGKITGTRFNTSSAKGGSSAFLWSLGISYTYTF